MSSIRLYLFQCGTLACQAGNLWEGIDDPTPIEIPVPWFVLDHPRGAVVFDGGNAPPCVADPLNYWGPIARDFYPRMTSADLCTAALGRIGLASSDVQLVVHSHLHADHTGALGQFPHAEHVVRDAEYQQARQAVPGDASGYISAEIARPDIRWRRLADSETWTDLLGDGSLIALPTPGHTWGHQSFLVRLPRTKHVLLAHDAVYTMAHWAYEQPSEAPVSISSSIRSIRRLKEIAHRYDALVVPGHDTQAWARFDKAPAYYD